MVLRVFLISMLFLLLQSCTKSQVTDQQVQEYLLQSKQIAQQFSSELKTELQNAIAESGPAEAIGVCKEVSVQVEERYTEEYPEITQLRRISHKVRNEEKHIPTQTELEQLQNMQSLIQQERKPNPIYIAEQDYLTVLLPIVVDDPTCLLCHGNENNIPAPVKEALNEHYPNDQATGFEMGDLRGALSIQWEIQ